MKAFFKILSLLTVTAFLSHGCKSSPVVDVLNIPSHPLETEDDLDALIAQAGNAKVVLLGEASHGTSEYYTWRATISKRLIEEKGFDFIAVEGEWADSYRVNEFIKGGPRDSIEAVNLLRQYNRWPTWMWGNHEVAGLVSFLNQSNQSKPATQKTGFYGLDVYCLWESMQELMPFIKDNDSLMRMADDVRQCFQPFSSDPMQYAYFVMNADENCRLQVENLYKAIMSYTGNKTAMNEQHFVMQQNALVAFNGERYYRAAASSNVDSWNIRDQHMAATIKRLLEFHGPDAKIIVWEHNTHVGDARFTDMAAAGMVNVGQLVREEYGQEQVYIVGFGSYSGEVIAAKEWGGPIEKMRVPKARKGSWEDILHKMGAQNKILFSNELRQNSSLMKSINHRAIGVQYNPGYESGNYVPTVIPGRYDAFVFIDQTTALRPINITAANEPPDTYPSGY